MYPAPRVTRHLPTRPPSTARGRCPREHVKKLAEEGGLAPWSSCPVIHGVLSLSRDPGKGCGVRAAPWRRAGGRWEAKAPGDLPALGPPWSGDLSPLRPSPGVVPAQAPVSPPRLSPRGPLSLPLPARS